MTKKQKLLRRALSGSKNLSFDDLTACAEAFGFRLDRINGSHHVYINKAVGEMLTFQSVKGKAKPYQVKQLLQVIEAHDLRLEDDA